MIRLSLLRPCHSSLFRLPPPPFPLWHTERVLFGWKVSWPSNLFRCWIMKSVESVSNNFIMHAFENPIRFHLSFIVSRNCYLYVVYTRVYDNYTVKNFLKYFFLILNLVFSTLIGCIYILIAYLYHKHYWRNTYIIVLKIIFKFNFINSIKYRYFYCLWYYWIKYGAVGKIVASNIIK